MSCLRALHPDSDTGSGLRCEFQALILKLSDLICSLKFTWAVASPLETWTCGESTSIDVGRLLEGLLT